MTVCTTAVRREKALRNGIFDSIILTLILFSFLLKTYLILHTDIAFAIKYHFGKS